MQPNHCIRADRHSFIITAALLLTLGFTTHGLAAIKMTPYLQAVTTDSVYVLVECDSTSAVRVDYGATTSYGSYATTQSTAATTASPVTYIHNVKLTGLQPNTLYHYKASQGSSSSADCTFNTAVNPGTNFRFAWMADCRTGTTVHDAISTRIKNAGPRFSLYGGDLCYDSTYSKFKSEFFRTNELALISRVPFFNAPGNHEGWSTNTKAFTQSPTSASGTQDYYSFDYGDAHFVSVNNEISDSVGSAQYNFVRDDLAGTTKPWKIVFFHQPAYCAGGHGENADMKSMTTNLFQPNKVDLVIAGHSHFYQHNLVNGIHHLVIGSAGAPLTDPGTASYVKKSAKSYCYAIVDVTPTSLHLVAYSDSGSVLDALDLTKQSPPAAPSGLTAAAVSGSQINLSWTDNSANESGFKLERSTNGTTFSQIATPAANAASYSDTGLAANTRYYYRVRSYNSVGDSAYSNVADAMTVSYKQFQTIAQAKAQPDGSYIDITGGSVVTLVPAESGVFYAQDADGTAGIRVEVSGSRPALGAVVKIKGQLGAKANGERATLGAAFSASAASAAVAVARGMNNKSVGGLGYIGSETSGISSQGLLVRIWGKVTKSVNDPTYGAIFWIDDGSRVDAGESDGTRGIKVIESGWTPTVGSFVKVAGVISSEIKSGKKIRVLRFREKLP